MTGEKSRRPQFVRIAEFLGLAAGEINNPCLGLDGDRRLLASRGRSSSAAIGPKASAANTALGSLMMHPTVCPTAKTTGLPVGQQHPRPLDPARRFRSRRAIAPNATNSSSPMANSIACRHAAMSSPSLSNQSRKPTSHVGKNESAHMISFKESMN